MALQDLTPQLRTRLSHLERMVGWFVALALGLLVFGFIYYVYHTAKRKGWFLTKAPYYTFVDRASGLRVGDPVKLMGFDAGTITDIKPMPASDFDYNVYIEFVLKSPNYGYMWTDGSHARVTAAGLLENRVLEVTRGMGGYPTYISYPLRNVTITEARSLPDLTNWFLAQEIHDATHASLLAEPRWPLTNLNAIAAAGYSNIFIMNEKEERKALTGIWNGKEGRYDFYTPNKSKYYLSMQESPSVTEQIEKLVGQVQQALPGVFALTNELSTVLSNTTLLTSNLNAVAASAQPAVSNLTAITAQLQRPGALGDWLLSSNLQHQLESTLGQTDATLVSANTNLAALAEKLGRSLDNLAGMTSNLNVQVQANTNILSHISRTIVDADAFIQGLKHHWLLRSAFRTRESNAPSTKPKKPARPLESPKEKGEK